MEILALLNLSESQLLKKIEEALPNTKYKIKTVKLHQTSTNECSQQTEILQEIKSADTLVYFASKENNNSKCIDIALDEASKLNIRIICIWLDKDATLASIFKNVGDSLISSISSLSQAITTSELEWQNSDGSLWTDRPFKRYKCGDRK